MANGTLTGADVAVGSLSGAHSPADYDSGWIPEDNAMSHLTVLTHNLGVYPTRCMVWFSPTDPPSGDIYPYGSCWNNPDNTNGNSFQNPVGWAVNTDDITLYIWDGTPLFQHWDLAWNQWTTGYFRVLLWE